MGKSPQVEHHPITRSVADAAMASFEEMDRLFGEFFSHRWPRSWLRPFRWEHPNVGDINSIGTLPRIDVLDRESEIVVRAALPGVKKEDLDVWVTDQAVTIRGCTRREQRTEAESYYRSEMARGEFVRSVDLPTTIDAGIARAKLENGVLEIVLPKTENARRHTIRIE